MPPPALPPLEPAPARGGRRRGPPSRPLKDFQKGLWWLSPTPRAASCPDLRRAARSVRPTAAPVGFRGRGREEARTAPECVLPASAFPLRFEPKKDPQDLSRGGHTSSRCAGSSSKSRSYRASHRCDGPSVAWGCSGYEGACLTRGLTSVDVDRSRGPSQ